MEKNLIVKKQGSQNGLPACREQPSSGKCLFEAITTEKEGVQHTSIEPTTELYKLAASSSVEELTSRVQSSFAAQMGVTGWELSKFIMGTTLSGMQPNADDQNQQNIVLQAFHELQPQDMIEGMLCSQAVSLYNQGMAHLQKVGSAKSPEMAEHWLQSSVKLLRLQQETIEKLERYRRKGEQRVVVQHVEVNNGGKAIVGNFAMQREGA